MDTQIDHARVTAGGFILVILFVFSLGGGL